MLASVLEPNVGERYASACRVSVVPNVLRPGDRVPGSPERCHFIPSTESDADMCVHGREDTSNQNIIKPKMLHNLTGGMIGIHHHEVGV